MKSMATRRTTARPAAPPTTPPAMVPAGGVVELLVLLLLSVVVVVLLSLLEVGEGDVLLCAVPPPAIGVTVEEPGDEGVDDPVVWVILLLV